MFQVVVEADPASLDRQITATQYADLTVQPGDRVLSDLRFDPRKHHLYVMTAKKVSSAVHSDKNTADHALCSRLRN